MRGQSASDDELFSFVRLEERVPVDHPLRAIRSLADEVLAGLSGRFSALYARTGRPSIPPEMLLRATLLQALYPVRSARMLMEQINYNLLFRWFVGLSMDAQVWHPTGFTHNRDRLLQADVARGFLQGLLALPRVKRLLSSEHFSVDSTLTHATGTAGRLATLTMLDRRPSTRRITLGADKAYDVADFVRELRARKVTPHIAVNGTVHKTGKRRKTAIGNRTRRHPGYDISLRCRKRIEEVFGWAKASAGLTKFKLRGLDKTTAVFNFFAAAYNLIRLLKLLTQ